MNNRTAIACAMAGFFAVLCPPAKSIAPTLSEIESMPPGIYAAPMLDLSGDVPRMKGLETGSPSVLFCIRENARSPVLFREFSGGEVVCYVNVGSDADGVVLQPVLYSLDPPEKGSGSGSSFD